MQERLQKIIAHAGIASRRKAEELILQGRVTLNGQIVEELGVKAEAGVDHIKVNGKLILAEAKEYLAFNKPRAVLSAVSDPSGRPVVTDYIRSRNRLYPAGRLDFNSEGLLIMTNDGALARQITEAGNLQKVYRVKVAGRPSQTALERLVKGVRIEGELLSMHRVKLLKRGSNCWYEVILKQGRNRQIRRMFEEIGHAVMRLRRTTIGPVRLGQLKPGEYRNLTERELHRLRQPRSAKQKKQNSVEFR
jgi:23S rRNA pseudouridine2605 synthase